MARACWRPVDSFDAVPRYRPATFHRVLERGESPISSASAIGSGLKAPVGRWRCGGSVEAFAEIAPLRFITRPPPLTKFGVGQACIGIKKIEVRGFARKSLETTSVSCNQEPAIGRTL